MSALVELLKYLFRIVFAVVIFRMLYTDSLSGEGGMVLLVLTALLIGASIATALIWFLTRSFFSRGVSAMLFKVCVFAISFELSYFLMFKKPCLFGLAAPRGISAHLELCFSLSTLIALLITEYFSYELEEGRRTDEASVE